jgi:hypothetical protein
MGSMDLIYYVVNAVEAEKLAEEVRFELMTVIISLRKHEDGHNVLTESLNLNTTILLTLCPTWLFWLDSDEPISSG